ncbi:MAG: hypothetical protein RJA36_1322 [Pseudomonadota bacterium]
MSFIRSYQTPNPALVRTCRKRQAAQLGRPRRRRAETTRQHRTWRHAVARVYRCGVALDLHVLGHDHPVAAQRSSLALVNLDHRRPFAGLPGRALDALADVDQVRPCIARPRHVHARSLPGLRMRGLLEELRRAHALQPHPRDVAALVQRVQVAKGGLHLEAHRFAQSRHVGAFGVVGQRQRFDLARCQMASCCRAGLRCLHRRRAGGLAGLRHVPRQLLGAQPAASQQQLADVEHIGPGKCRLSHGRPSRARARLARSCS